MKRFDLAIKFQYNSCYCLSKNKYLGQNKSNYFNTTLVTVYPAFSRSIGLMA
ncbi:hypothetical protein ANACAC_03484 [Anaerostipes caccae L1-92]|uniref:Uncharacterized protein n=1 Tax=Anaerostipes caccae (strain DSM 14662 / CCUG 47493 / JCM 13470 / NCIMB 13811 / L1-92) TaxID=411490 RepID=B0MIM9_ANACD|nr:hypothetical protein ANACAC_03484 [Anaerostipes caccae L1-92]